MMHNSGGIIRARRKELKLTQKEVAVAAGVTAVAVGHWENNTHKPKGVHLMRLCRKLGIRPADVVGEKALRESEIERQAEQIKRAFMSSSEELRGAALRMFGIA